MNSRKYSNLKVSDLTLNALTPFVTGQDSSYKSGPDIIKFFNAFGINDEYSYQNGGLPNAWSRNRYAYETLKIVNGTLKFKSLIEALADSRTVNNPDDIASQISEIIKYDGYKLEKNESGIYEVTGDRIEDSIVLEAHFQEIKTKIIENIRNAKFSIWVAVAWFTDKDFCNELIEKHRSGINVRVIVNDDQNTDKHGVRFDPGIEYTKVSPNSPWGKKLMHNKFCVIDLCKVLHGSFNWTSNANYNDESIAITEDRDFAEKFSTQFIQLRNQKSA